MGYGAASEHWDWEGGSGAFSLFDRYAAEDTIGNGIGYHSNDLISTLSVIGKSGEE